jgi:2-oxoglutarate ferredoxin oxidoreductase subunit delta
VAAKHRVVIRREFCKGCNLCVEFCAKKVLRPSEQLNRAGYYYADPVNMAACSGCLVCAMVCPDCVIEVYVE